MVNDSPSTHAQANNRAIGGARFDAIIRLDEGLHAFEQNRARTSECLFVIADGPPEMAAWPSSITTIIGLARPLRDKIIENPVGFAVSRPRGLVVARAVLEKTG
jgi:hypothetical protein